MGKLLRFLMRPGVALLLSIGVIVLYTLSAGPAFWMMWNVSLPRIAGDGFRYFYTPLAWVAQKSNVGEVLESYAALWIDESRPAATDIGTWSQPPPFFLEIAGALLGAWLIWNFVRWVNQMKTKAA
ncbi:MAG TPA: hypothetical protein VGM05_26495 [Planctomycetaceae bacterium]